MERTMQQLKSMQAAPLNVKVLLTKQRIREWVNEFGTDGVYVSFSGGKDSTVLLHIMRAGYIGRKILVDVSTEHNELYQCGILENYIPYESFMRSIVYVGDRQRKLITHYPGVEIFECLPWDYEKRVKP